ncbi:MAG: hypothetical protein EOP50_22050 [Sphingobacteriales bacterium]|nr:MAG: hypothetical protein EOP50_22050 [Sphingobacteriales bacterium]
MDISSGLAAASQAIGITKTLRSIEKDYDAAAYKGQIAELMLAVADTKMALSDARDAIADRDKEIARLKVTLAEKATLTKGLGEYQYHTDDDGHPFGYPICPKCEVVDARIVTLKQNKKHWVGACPVCATVYDPVAYYLPYTEGGPRTALERDRQARQAQPARTRLRGY